MTGIELIAQERERQIAEEGWTAKHDDIHANGELANAAAMYAITPLTREDGAIAINKFPSWLWPWDRSWWKPGDRLRELAKAGALIAAEIDRLSRATPTVPFAPLCPRCNGCITNHEPGCPETHR